MGTEKMVELSLFTDFDISRQEIGAEIVSILFISGREYAPEKVDYGKNWKIVNSNDLASSLEFWTKTENILFRRDSIYQSEIAITRGRSVPTPTFISCWIDESYFLDSKHIDSFLETSKQLYNLIHPKYGLIHRTEDKIKIATINHPIYGKTITPINLQRNLPGIYWANYFGPSFVEKFGRIKLLSAPSYIIDELSDGGILIITGPTPLVQKSPETVVIQNELRIYIGDEFFYP